MHKYKIILLISIGFFLWAGLYGQNDTLSFYRETQKINNRGMVVLGTWAITNITVGAFGMRNSTGENKYFHQMNLLWNTVNASNSSSP